ncbi:MAG: 3-isopropylmalate dehydratase large subunit, partial [Candidatus Ratteibacteria bacterium]|nr:3-isopropylmalate dehydratase large subunit [Candidatus Ratteibacteria bacterium]
MTITEKIIAQHSGKDRVSPGEFVESNVDLILANDITAPLSINEFEKAGAKEVFNPDKIVLVPDHFTPCKD